MLKNGHDRYYEEKITVLRKETQLAAEGKATLVPMYLFYYYEMEASLIYICKDAEEQVKKAIAILEKEVK